MRRLILAAAAAAAFATPVTAAPGGTGGSGADSQVWTTVTAAQARALVEEAGGTVTGVTDGEEGFSVEFTFANGLTSYAEGFACEGTGADAVCADIEIGGTFTADSVEHAQQLERDLSFIWIADYAEPDTTTYMVWRRDCLHGGMTRAQVALLFEIMENQLAEVANRVWPDDATVPASARNVPVET